MGHASSLWRKYPSPAGIGQLRIEAGLALKRCFPIGREKHRSSGGFFLYRSASYVFYYESELKVASLAVEAARELRSGDLTVVRSGHILFWTSFNDQNSSITC